MKHRIQVSDEVALNVDDFGSGQPLVFLHGWPANNTMFEYQADFVVANGYRYIGIDHRGFGLSDRAADGYDYDTIADDIQKVVDELNLKDYIVVGFSVGGALALKYGVKHNNDNLKKNGITRTSRTKLRTTRWLPVRIKSRRRYGIN